MSNVGYNWVARKDVTVSGESTTPSYVITNSAYADIAYINGHGSALKGIYVQNSQGQTTGFITPCINAHKSNCPNCTHTLGEIGITSTGISTTNSKFNQKLKWLIISACSQLDHGTVKWDNMTPAQMWAKTMLGNPSSGNNRLHGIIGYYGSAPSYPVDYDRIYDFLDDTIYLDNSYSVKNAWYQANELLYGSSNWAALCANTIYYDYSYDKLPNYNSSKDFFPSPAYTSTRIDRYQRGNINNYNILSSKTNNIVYNDNDYTISKKKLYSTDNTDILYKNIYDEILYDFDIQSKNSIEKDIYIYEKENITNKESEIVYTPSDAINISKIALYNINHLPNDNYYITVSPILKQDMLTVKDEITIGYIVKMYPTYNNKLIYDVDNKETGAVISMDNNGIKYLHSKKVNFDYNNIHIREKALDYNNSINAFIQKYNATFDVVETKKDIDLYDIYVYKNGNLSDAVYFTDANTFNNGILVE